MPNIKQKFFASQLSFSHTVCRRWSKRSRVDISRLARATAATFTFSIYFCNLRRKSFQSCNVCRKNILIIFPFNKTNFESFQPSKAAQNSFFLVTKLQTNHKSYSIIVYLIKMEYGSKNNIFDIKIILKSSIGIFILKSIHSQILFLWPYDLLHNRKDLCLK